MYVCMYRPPRGLVLLTSPACLAIVLTWSGSLAPKTVEITAARIPWMGGDDKERKTVTKIVPMSCIMVPFYRMNSLYQWRRLSTLMVDNISTNLH